MRRLPLLSALTAGLLLVMSGIAMAADVAIEDNGLSPTRVVVDVREPIVWTNNTDEPVSLVGESPAWESGEIEPGATFSIEITRAGTYSYTSENDALRGQIVVREAKGEDAEGDDAEGDDAQGEGTEGGDTEGEDVEETVDPDEEALPETGMNVVLPGALSLLLMAFGAGLLVVTHPVRALRRRS